MSGSRRIIEQDQIDCQLAISAYLRSYRLYKGWTVERAGHEADIAYSAIYSFENRSSWTLSMAWRIAKSHGLNMSTLFEFAEVAAQNGIVSAYSSEAPHLLEPRQPVKKKLS